MGERGGHAPGTFSWVDLSTTDAEAAKAFYSGLFGWQIEDLPTGDGVYSMGSIGGRNVAAIAEQAEQERAMGVPPHWNNYVTVESADATAGKALELGGNVILEPFDVLEAGRMAVIADPGGAVFSVWEPKQQIGAELVNERGALCWNDLGTHEPQRVKGFYEALLGWSTEDLAGGAYTVVRVGGHTNGGIRPMGEDESGVPSYWLPYFAVESADDAAAKAKQLGATALVEPMDVPAAADVPLMDGSESSEQNRLAVIADPQGAAFGIFSGALDP
jgi:uncharacterized protein